MNQTTTRTRSSTTQDASPPLVDVVGLCKSFGDLAAVQEVSFQIASGETYGLLGPNGAGKTTTISMVAGLLEKDRGTVQVAGKLIDTTTISPRAAIGLVPQEIAIYPDLTGEENLRFFGRLYGMKGKPLTERIKEVLEVIGLTERARDRTDKYSGGMKRRLNIGIGLLHHPRLLILDEPTVGVDPQSRNAILDSVERLSAAGMAVLYTTHYMEEAERLCDRVGIIDRGQIIAEGTRRELVQRIGEEDRVELSGGGNIGQAASRIEQLSQVREVVVGEGVLGVLTGDASGMLSEILSSASDAGMAIHRVEVTEPDLEAVFLHLTGKALRD